MSYTNEPIELVSRHKPKISKKHSKEIGSASWFEKKKQVPNGSPCDKMSISSHIRSGGDAHCHNTCLLCSLIFTLVISG